MLPPSIRLFHLKRKRFQKCTGSVFSFSFSKLFSFYTDIQHVITKLVWILRR